MADFYELLGVARDADADTLKRAYRRMARQYHPDINKEAGAEDRFKEIGRAYEVLSDPQSRARYDQFGEAGLARLSFVVSWVFVRAFFLEGFQNQEIVNLSK